jgi:hypothetical protein
MTETIWMGMLAASLLAVPAAVSWVALSAWQGWLELKRLELRQDNIEQKVPLTGDRIELADLRERVRKLESIAAGIDI